MTFCTLIGFGRSKSENKHGFRLLKLLKILACLLVTSQASVQAVPLPPTDNTSAPYMGLYGWALDNPTPGEGMAHVDYTATWLNRSNLWVEDFNATDNWSTLTSVWAYKRAKAWLRTHPGTYISTVGMFPRSGGFNLAAGAAGTYNSYWTTLAQNIVSQGIADNTIIRLGHEFNGTWYAWSVRNQTDALNFAEYWRRIVTTIRAVPGAANIKFNWNGCHGWSAFNLADAYPGDAYVDTIGVDVYDQSWDTVTYPYTNTVYPYGADALARQQKAWNGISGTNNYGITWWKNFAATHGKPLTIPEWGLAARTDTHGGLDNTFFVQKMYDFIQDPANNVAWHVYFDVWASDGNHLLTQQPGRSATNFPNSAALFRKLFGVKPLPNANDIGTVGLPGGSDPVSITGAGTGYLASTTTDHFHFAHRDAATNDLMVARIDSMTAGSGSQGGVMLRQSTAANSPYFAISVKDGSCIFTSRDTAGASATQNFVAPGVTFPIWLKLVRRGNVVTGYRSSDGRNWTYSGGKTVTLAGTSKLGLAAGSGSTTSLNTVAVDSVDRPSIVAVDPGIASALMMDVSSSTLAPGITVSSGWQGSSTLANHFGGTQRYNWAPGTPTAMRFTPTIAEAGLYEVYVRWWDGQGHQFADCMPITMTSLDGTTSRLVNQKVNAGIWNYIGTYHLAAGTAGNLYLNNTGCQGEENGYLRIDAAMFVPLPVASGTAPGSTFESWTATAFTAPQIAAGESAADADPDHDGLSNLAEYSLGGQPYAFTPPLPVTVGTTSLTITFQRPAARADITYHAEASPDFTTWTPLTLEVLNPGADPEAVRATYTLPVPTPDRSFIRLRFKK